MPLTNDLTKFSTASPVVASYSYTDIANGLGYISSYLANEQDSGGVGYFLTDNTSISSTSISIGVGEGASATEYDFDLSPFQIARTIKGKVIINLYGGLGGSSGDNNETIQITAVLKKYDGSTETTLLTMTGNTRTDSGGAAGVGKPWTYCMTGDAAETQFAAGENVRLTLRVTTNSVSGTGFYQIGADPSNRAQDEPYYDVNQSNSKILIPFKLDI